LAKASCVLLLLLLLLVAKGFTVFAWCCVKHAVDIE
jgi:hypothetical protein